MVRLSIANQLVGCEQLTRHRPVNEIVVVHKQTRMSSYPKMNGRYQYVIQRFQLTNVV